MIEIGMLALKVQFIKKNSSTLMDLTSVFIFWL